MRTVQTFWRYHNKPRSMRPRRVIASNPDPGTVEHIRHLMKQAADTAIAAGLPRPSFPFNAADVEAIYTHKRDAGDGLWFALIDGRVFRSDGDPDTNDPDAYGDAMEA
jgi:hypothetical protein